MLNMKSPVIATYVQIVYSNKSHVPEVYNLLFICQDKKRMKHSNHNFHIQLMCNLKHKRKPKYVLWEVFNLFLLSVFVCSVKVFDVKDFWYVLCVCGSLKEWKSFGNKLKISVFVYETSFWNVWGNFKYFFEEMF